MKLLHHLGLSLLLSIGLPVFAQQTTGVVSGTVHYGDTGKPASGINLWLTSAEATAYTRPDPKTGDYVLNDKTLESEKKLFTQVGANGTFVLHDVPPGTYLVHIYSPPYISPDGTVFPTSNTAHVAIGPLPSRNALKVTVVANQSTKPIQIELQRGGAIEGFVRLAIPANGTTVAPPAGFAVNAELKLGANSYARAGGPAHTDAKGYYRLEGLAPGSYIVFIGQGGPMVLTANGSSRGSGGLPIYAPDTVRPSRAAVVNIKQAETQQLDIVLPDEKTLHRIDGHVEVEGADLQNAIVRLYPTNEGGLTASCPLSARKSFSFFDVPDGDYTVEVEFPPTTTLVGVDAANGLIQMRMTPSNHATATHDIHITGHDVTDILVTPALR